MEAAIRMKNMVLGVLAMIGSALSNLLGGWDITLQILLCCMAADYITGLVVAGVFHNSGKTQTGALESRAGFKGLVRKCAILLLVFLAGSVYVLCGERRAFHSGKYRTDGRALSGIFGKHAGSPEKAGQ